MKRTLLIICAVVVFLYFLLVVLVSLSELIIDHEADYMEAGISRALENKNLVPGSKLKIWVQYLGEPDLIANCENVFDTAKLFWLKKGIGVQVDGHADTNLNPLLNERVTLVILPVRKKSAPVLMRGCRFVGNDNRNQNEIEFESLLDVKVNGSRINDMKESDIRKLYENYDASNDYYYNSSFPFHKDTVRLIRYPDPDCSIACRDEINAILIGSSDMFSVAEAPRFLKKLVLFPYKIMKLAWQTDQ